MKNANPRSEMNDFNAWLGKLPYTHKIVIGGLNYRNFASLLYLLGNHDGILCKLGKAAASQLLSNVLVSLSLVF